MSKPNSCVICSALASNVSRIHPRKGVLVNAACHSRTASARGSQRTVMTTLAGSSSSSCSGSSMR